jgi:hypothetical protein
MNTDGAASAADLGSIMGISECRSAAVLRLLNDGFAGSAPVVAHAHPNGFLRLNFGSDQAGDVVRIHRWTADSVDSDIHNHRWAYRSLALKGEIVQEKFDVRPLPRGENGVQIEPPRSSEGDGRRILECDHRGPGAYAFTDKGIVNIEKTDISAFQPGAVSSLADWEFHRISARVDSYTLMLHSKAVRSKTLVVPDDDRGIEHIDMHRLASSDVRLELTKLWGILQDAVPGRVGVLARQLKDGWRRR